MLGNESKGYVIEQTCRQFSRSYLHYIIGKEETACHLISIHNLHYLINLMLGLRQSILDDRLSDFVNEFMQKWYGKEQYPEWVVEALRSSQIELKNTNNA